MSRASLLLLHSQSPSEQMLEHVSTEMTSYQETVRRQLESVVEQSVAVYDERVRRLDELATRKAEEAVSRSQDKLTLWQAQFGQDVEALQRRSASELRVEVRKAIRSDADAIAALDEQIWLTEQRLRQRIDEVACGVNSAQLAYGHPKSFLQGTSPEIKGVLAPSSVGATPLPQRSSISPGHVRDLDREYIPGSALYIEGSPGVSPVPQCSEDDKAFVLELSPDGTSLNVSSSGLSSSTREPTSALDSTASASFLAGMALTNNIILRHA